MITTFWRTTSRNLLTPPPPFFHDTSCLASIDIYATVHSTNTCFDRNNFTKIQCYFACQSAIQSLGPIVKFGCSKCDSCFISLHQQSNPKSALFWFSSWLTFALSASIYAVSFKKIQKIVLRWIELNEWGRWLEGWPNTAARLAG